MIKLKNGCYTSDIKVHPKNWQSTRASTKKDWYIFYRFYDPSFKKYVIMPGLFKIYIMGLGKKLSFCTYNNNCLIVINPQGKIRVLYTPIKVVCNQNIIEQTKTNLMKGTTVYVDEVYNNIQNELLFRINGWIYSYKYFQIVVKF